MSSAPVYRVSAYQADRRLLIKAGGLVCLGVFVLAGCSGDAAPVRQMNGSAPRHAPSEVRTAAAMGRPLPAYPATLPSASSPLLAQADERNQTTALVLFTAMRKARVLHGLR